MVLESYGPNPINPVSAFSQSTSPALGGSAIKVSAPTIKITSDTDNITNFVLMIHSPFTFPIRIRLQPSKMKFPFHGLDCTSPWMLSLSSICSFRISVSHLLSGILLTYQSRRISLRIARVVPPGESESPGLGNARPFVWYGATADGFPADIS